MTNIKLLSVDDDPFILEFFQDIFEEYNVTTFIDSNKALEQIKKQQFHFIFLDIYMSPLTGLDLCKEARKTPFNKDSFIYAFTSEDRQNVLASFYDIDFDDIIHKMTDYNIIKKKIRADVNREKRSKILNLYNSNVISELSEITQIHDYSLNNISLALTNTEYKILKVLKENQHRSLSSGDIRNIITNNYINSESSTVREHISNIKNKFKNIDDSTTYIQTTSEGYILKNC